MVGVSGGGKTEDPPPHPPRSVVESEGWDRWDSSVWLLPQEPGLA
jgi:hypothetical protein